MDWLKGFNAAIDYIEDNLENEIDYSTAARAACCSEFHFSRMFSSLAGISLSEYIRHRRLTKAAFDLQLQNAKIMDVALKYGYESPDAFIVAQPQNAQVQRRISSPHIVRHRRRSYGYAVLAFLVGIASRSLSFKRFGVGRLYTGVSEASRRCAQRSEKGSTAKSVSTDLSSYYG